MARAAHQPQNQRHDGQADDDADQRGLHQVAQPELQSHLVEAKTLFNFEGAVERERQVQQPANQAERAQQRQLRHQRAVSSEAGVHDGPVQRVQAAQQRPAHQYGGGKRHFQQAKTGLGDGVIGGFLVRLQRNRGGKRGRHGAAVQRHMADLPRGQIKARQQPENEQGGEQPGKNK